MRQRARGGVMASPKSHGGILIGLRREGRAGSDDDSVGSPTTDTDEPRAASAVPHISGWPILAVLECYAPPIVRSSRRYRRALIDIFDQSGKTRQSRGCLKYGVANAFAYDWSSQATNRWSRAAIGA